MVGLIDEMQVFHLFLPGVRGPSPWKILKTKNTGEAICGHFAMQLKSYDYLNLPEFSLFLAVSEKKVTICMLLSVFKYNTEVFMSW